ncbi:MAG: hypothetical protein JXR37_18135 [Kiritimatiellae bacterium]|nr:hypothetical protein [Kiritimatiellia bacterium]
MSAERQKRENKRRVLELLLDAVRLEATGVRRGASSRHLVLVSLVWPRPMIAERVAAKTVLLDAGAADWRAHGWTRRVCFKETVEGPLGVRVCVSRPLPDERVAELVRVVGAGVLKLAGGEAEDWPASGVAGALLGLPFAYLGKRLAAAGEAAGSLVAEGETDLDTNAWPGQEHRTFQIAMTAPAGVQFTRRARKKGAQSARRRTALAAGAANGVVHFSARVW